jgi:hypothetical protein
MYTEILIYVQLNTSKSYEVYVMWVAYASSCWCFYKRFVNLLAILLIWYMRYICLYCLIKDKIYWMLRRVDW